MVEGYRPTQVVLATFTALRSGPYRQSAFGHDHEDVPGEDDPAHLPSVRTLIVPTGVCAGLATSVRRVHGHGHVSFPGRLNSDPQGRLERLGHNRVAGVVSRER